MKTLAYLDAPTGIAGDMCLGALVHAGVPLAYLEAQLGRLGIQNEFSLRTETVQRNQQAATKVHVEVLDGPSHHEPSHHDHGHSHEGHDHDRGHAHEHSHSHAHSDGHTHGHSHDHHGHSHGNRRRLPQIEALIQQAALPTRVVSWSLAIFRRLATAEAAVHGIPPEQVHFHEVGATDAIVDIVGTCLGLDWLKVDAVVCSPLPTGSGTVWCEHGLLPVPAPAVLNMMADVQMPVYDNGIAKELVTPTGCAIAVTLAQSFGPPPSFTLQKIGLGAGGRDLPLPNILRLWIGTVEKLPKPVLSGSAALSKSALSGSATSKGAQAVPEVLESEPLESEPLESEPLESEPLESSAMAQPDTIAETIVELQTQLDDCSPQAIGYVFEQLFSAGAVDVFTQSVAMKKNRLGTLVTVICPEAAAAECETVLFAQTTTLGVRRTVQQRSALAREMVSVETAYGGVAIKVARRQPGAPIVNRHPEYEDCATLARSHNVPWQTVHQAALAAAATLT